MNHHRLTRSTALGLVLAALAVPTAAAMPVDPVSPSQTSGPAGTASPTPSQDLRNPDNVDPAASPWQDLRAPDVRDAAEGRGTFTAPAVTVVEAPEPAPAVSDRIEWGDAGIGAGALLGLIVLSLGGTMAVARHRRGGAARSGPATTG